MCFLLFVLRSCTCIHWLSFGNASCKSLAHHALLDMLGERRGAVHSSSATHIVGGGLLGDLDLERAPSCGAAHVMAAHCIICGGDRVRLGVLLRERAPARAGVRERPPGYMPCDAGDLELMVLPSSVAFSTAMGFTGGRALLDNCSMNNGFA